jgi:hypothetical protein
MLCVLSLRPFTHSYFGYHCLKSIVNQLVSSLVLLHYVWNSKNKQRRIMTRPIPKPYRLSDGESVDAFISGEF